MGLIERFGIALGKKIDEQGYATGSDMILFFIGIGLTGISKRLRRWDTV